MEKSVIELFSYSKKDLYFNIECNNQDSSFDLLLKKKWVEAEQNKLLCYSANTQQSKVLQGQYGFYVQLNIERATLRRKPDDITSMFQQFDSNKFNFNKIPDKEILFDIGNGNGNYVVAVNVSPIVWSHSLFLSERMSNLPQQVTLSSFQKAIEIILLSNSENIRVLFNSLCANASVNHLHWHIYYLNHRMVLESLPLQYFIGLVYIFKNFPAKGFCIKLSSFHDKNINKCACYAYKIVSNLQKNQIAHNIYITRSQTDVKKKVFDDLRIYIWARTTSYGIKNTKDFIIAACELFGHLPIRSQKVYENINEQYVSECLQNVTADAFVSAQKIITEVFSNNLEEKTNLSL